MNALLAIGRLVLAHREKAVLILMMLLCGTLAGITQMARQEDGPTGETLTTEQVIGPLGTPRSIREYPPAELRNPQSWDEVRGMLDRRRSPFRPGVAGVGGRAGEYTVEEAWPAFRVRRVSQPTPGGDWIAQLEIESRAYIVREGRSFANNQYELQRIDKTRLCVEVLRRLDDEVREFCQE